MTGVLILFYLAALLSILLSGVIPSTLPMLLRC
jgi:hypothetical protein